MKQAHSEGVATRAAAIKAIEGDSRAGRVQDTGAEVRTYRSE